MRPKKIFSTILIGFLAIGLVGCGNSNQPKHKVKHSKTVKMTDNNITGGSAEAENPTVVHSTAELKQVLAKKKPHSKDILINTNLNGNTDGYLQDKIQISENKLDGQISKLKQRPKAVTSTNNLTGLSKKQKQNNKKKAQQQWRKQQQQQKQLKQIAKQHRKEFNNLIKQDTHVIKIKIPSNTTISEDPNTQLQNITFIPKGHNIIFRNLNMQAPVNYMNNQQLLKNNAIYLHHSNGVLLDHDTFTNSDDTYHTNRSPKDNQKNKKQGNNHKQHQQINPIINISNQAHHTVIKNNRYININKAIIIGSPQSQKVNTDAYLTHNLFEDVSKSAPEVCHSKVTLNQNYYSNDNQKQNKYNSAITWGQGAKIDAKQNDFIIAKLNSYRIAKSLVVNYHTWHGNSFNGLDFNIDGHNFKYQVRNGQLNILKDNSSAYQAPSIDSYAKNGAVLGRNQALGS